ncbi:MAG: class I SAM-dependent methyltransferase [Bauldia sp.]|nr:class I SAM-dependent methyltransferase [Bauldia sp.]
MASRFGKVEITEALADRFGYRRYLEIATSTTGGRYHALDRARFEECRRLLYDCPADFDDGMPVDYAARGPEIGDALDAIAAADHRFDVMLVDPHHTYDASLRDIAAAFDLLAPGGAMVVHDCLPPNEATASPTPRSGAWCGVTYKAFLDFVSGRTDLRYVTVDTDYGCGVIRKVDAPREGVLQKWRRRRERAAWAAVGEDTDAAWSVFSRHRRGLLRLIGVDRFLRRRDGLGWSMRGDSIED